MLDEVRGLPARPAVEAVVVVAGAAGQAAARTLRRARIHGRSTLVKEALGAPVTMPLLRRARSFGCAGSDDPSRRRRTDRARGAALDGRLRQPQSRRHGHRDRDSTREQARAGFDRLLVLGVQLGASDAEGKAALEELLEHHHYGLGGLEVLAQGTPTHNTTGASSGYGRGDNSGLRSELRRPPRGAAVHRRGATTRGADGQCLAEALGVDPALLQQVHGAGGEDQLRAGRCNAPCGRLPPATGWTRC